MIVQPNDDRPDLAALVIDDDLFDRAVADAQADAARRHRLLGEPLLIWRDGRVVAVPAHEIPVPSTDPHPPAE